MLWNLVLKLFLLKKVFAGRKTMQTHNTSSKTLSKLYLRVKNVKVIITIFVSGLMMWHDLNLLL